MTRSRQIHLLAAKIRILVAASISVTAFLFLPYLHYTKQVMATAHLPALTASAKLAAKIYEFRLKPTSRARGASGTGYLRIAPSPFDIAVTKSGKLIYNLELTINGLLPPASLGPYQSYIVWITTPKLDRTEKLGALPDDGKFKATVSSMNKFILMITAEPSANIEKRSGPIVLRGISPSGLLEPFQNHELFNNIPH